MPATCISQKRLKIDEYMQRGILQALNPLSNRAKCAKKVLKWRISELTGLINGYMLQGVLQALNPLSIYVTSTAIVPGAYPGRPKCAKNVLKWRTSELTSLINGYMLRCV